MAHHIMKSMARRMGIGGGPAKPKKGRAASSSTADPAFEKLQSALDKAYRAIHEATNQKQLDKAKRLWEREKKKFDVGFAAHEKRLR